ncbi:MAG: hypothetical protein M1829_002490 [Trizodia sp. TS-e1964]|nr:MAG: hypothetical protein M1829_002490 [Trizodia sp. TS-e1964]
MDSPDSPLRNSEAKPQFFPSPPTTSFAQPEHQGLNDLSNIPHLPNLAINPEHHESQKTKPLTTCSSPAGCSYPPHDPEKGEPVSGRNSTLSLSPSQDSLEKLQYHQTLRDWEPKGPQDEAELSSDQQEGIPTFYELVTPDSPSTYLQAVAVSSSSLGQHGSICTKAPRILLKLAFILPPMALLTSLMALLILLALIASSPLRCFAAICQRHKNRHLKTSDFAIPSFGAQVVNLLSPIQRFHLRQIYAHVRLDPPTTYHPPSLILLHIVLPFLALGVAAAAWTVAFFWLYAAVLGNPDGRERGDTEGGDGRMAAVNVQRWWEKVLYQAAVE